MPEFFLIEQADILNELITMNSDLGHIRGKARDIFGNVLRGARISVRENDQHAYSDFQGNFVIVNIVPGLYSLIADCEGFATTTLVDISISKGDNPGHEIFFYPQRAVYLSSGIPPALRDLEFAGSWGS